MAVWKLLFPMLAVASALTFRKPARIRHPIPASRCLNASLLPRTNVDTW